MDLSCAGSCVVLSCAGSCVDCFKFQVFDLLGDRIPGTGGLWKLGDRIPLWTGLFWASIC